MIVITAGLAPLRMLVVDLYPHRIIATVFGVIAAGSGLGGILSMQLVGELASGGAHAAPFLIMGAAPVGMFDHMAIDSGAAPSE